MRWLWIVYVHMLNCLSLNRIHCWPIKSRSSSHLVSVMKFYYAALVTYNTEDRAQTRQGIKNKQQNHKSKHGMAEHFIQALQNHSLPWKLLPDGPIVVSLCFWTKLKTCRGDCHPRRSEMMNMDGLSTKSAPNETRNNCRCIDSLLSPPHKLHQVVNVT